MVVGEDLSKDNSLAQQASSYWYVARFQSKQEGEGIENPAQTIMYGQPGVQLQVPSGR